MSIAGIDGAPRRRDFLDVTADWAKDPTKPFKAVAAFADFLNNTLVDSPGLSLLSAGAKDAKNACAPVAFLDKVNVLRNTVYSYYTGQPLGEERCPKTAAAIFRATLGLVAPVHDFTSLVSKKFCQVSNSFLNVFKGVHGSILSVMMLWNSYDNIEALRKGCQLSPEVFTINMLKLVQHVSFLALGIMTTLSGFWAVAFPPLAYATLGVTTVTFGYVEHFYKNIGTVKTIKE